MKRVRKIFAALLAAAVASVMSAFAAHAAVPSNQSEAKDGVVLIQGRTYQDLEGNTWIEYGSGFAVGKADQPVRYIVTNAHVVGSETSVTVYFNGAANKYNVAEVYAIDTPHDLAILRLPEPTVERKALAIASYSEVDTGETVYTLGYPEYAMDINATGYMTLGTNDIVTTQGIVSQITRINTTSNVGVDVVMTDATIDHGNSGGPMVKPNGVVIGVNTWGITSSATDGGYAVSTDYLTTLLRSEGIEYETSATISSPAAEAQPSVNDPSGQDGPVKPEPVNPGQGQETNMTLIIIIVLAVVVVAAVIVIIVVVAGKKKQPAPAPIPAPVPPPAPAPVSPAPQQPSAFVNGVSGNMSGTSYPINDIITIGRNSEVCNICFPVNTQGISGIHCQIMKQGRGYVIMDKGSSYGTFLGSGVKLQPNVPTNIGSGEYFYLGSRDQMFQIKF